MLLNFKLNLIFFFFFFYVSISVYFWLAYLTREFSYKGWGSQFILKIFKLGFIIFIFSEIIFFFRFFWTFFHFIFLISTNFGGFPGEGLITSDFKFLPLFNTLLLLRRGVSLTNGHLRLIRLKKKNFLINIIITLLLGSLFISCQLLEYSQLFFSIIEGVYPRIFYLTTSFHGIHVLIGWIILSLVYLKIFPIIFLLFEMASWYWHFVDIVWLFLFIFFYWGIKL